MALDAWLIKTLALCVVKYGWKNGWEWYYEEKKSRVSQFRSLKAEGQVEGNRRDLNIIMVWVQGFVASIVWFTMRDIVAVAVW